MANIGLLNETLAADGQSEEVTVRGRTLVHLSNNFGGGTAKVQIRVDLAGGMEWDDIVDGSFTAAADKIFDFPNDNQIIRVDLSGSTSPDLDISIRGS